METKDVSLKNGKRTFRDTMHKMYKDRTLYLLLLPAIAVTLLFCYGPMPGLIMAFEDFKIYDGIFGSKWVGLENIKSIFRQTRFLQAVWNTFYSNVLCILTGFPAPIILALLLNELKNKIFKKFVQTASYLPHFLSWISVVGIVQLLFGKSGLINDLRVWLGANERLAFLGIQDNFIWFVVFVPFWKGLGWATIIHLANLTSIDQTLYEAAEIDGASRLQQLRYITLPHMLPTCMILLIFQMGTLFGSNFELVYGLQNPYVDFEVISTLIYQTGVQNGNYSVSTAIGFVQGIVALILVLITNWTSKKASGTGIW